MEHSVIANYKVFEVASVSGVKKDLHHESGSKSRVWTMEGKSRTCTGPMHVHVL